MKVFKWDDDLAVELPQALVEQLNLAEGDDVEIVAADARTILISKGNEAETAFLRKLREFPAGPSEK